MISSKQIKEREEKPSQAQNDNPRIVVKSETDFIQCGKITEIKSEENYYNIVFTSLQGKTAEKRLYHPKEDNEMSKDIFLRFCTNILNRFNINEEIKANTPIEFANKVFSLVNPLLRTKEVYCLVELSESKDGKIYTNIGSFSPFADKEDDLYVSKKQKDLLAKKQSYKPSDESQPIHIPNGSSMPDELPF